MSSNRTTIVIDPLIHKQARTLAKQAGMTLGTFIGHLVSNSVTELADLIAERTREEDPRINQIREILAE